MPVSIFGDVDKETKNFPLVDEREWNGAGRKCIEFFKKISKIASAL